MPSTTSTYKIPYASSGDKIADYPATSKNLADRLEAITRPSASALTAYVGWTITGQVKTSGAVHTASINVNRSSESFSTTIDGTFQIATLPAAIPAPADGEILGLVQFGGYSCPIKYAANSRGIICHPLAIFNVSKQSTGLGAITWIA